MKIEIITRNQAREIFREQADHKLKALWREVDNLRSIIYNLEEEIKSLKVKLGKK